MWKVGGEGVGDGSGMFRQPYGVCPGGFGRWLVVNDDRIHVLSGEGEHVCHLLKGKLYNPDQACVTEDGYLLVNTSWKIKIFTYY